MTKLPDWYNNSFDKKLREDPLDLKADPAWQQIYLSGTDYLAQMLSTPHIGHSVSSYLASEFNKNTTAYDEAIDKVYNTTHIGGPLLHHNLDGQHTIIGAFEALREAFPNDPTDELILKEAIHLVKDLTTPSGINPFLEPMSFQQAKDTLVDSYHLPASYVNDLLNFDAVELSAVILACMRTLHPRNDESSARLGSQIGRLATLGCFDANLISLLLAGLFLGQAYIKCEPLPEILYDGASGSFSAAIFLKVLPYFHGPLFVFLGMAMVASFGTRWVFNEISKDIGLEMEDSLERLFPAYRGYYTKLK